MGFQVGVKSGGSQELLGSQYGKNVEKNPHPPDRQEKTADQEG